MSSTDVVCANTKLNKVKIKNTTTSLNKLDFGKKEVLKGC